MTGRPTHDEDAGAALPKRFARMRMDDAAAMDRLSAAAGESHPTLANALATAREQLDMEIAWIGRIHDGRQHFLHVDGDARALADGVLPEEDAICHHVLAGRAPEVIPDTRALRVLRDLGAVREGRIGAYVGVPVRFSDGRLYGTICCASREADPRLGERDARFMRVLARVIADQLEREELESEKNRLAAEATGVRALLGALAARDHYTRDHSHAVVELAASTARELGLAPREISDVEQVARLHDIGKVGIPDAILRKPGPLDDQEWAVMRTHPAIGAEIVAEIDTLATLAPAVRAEHERWDGSGYPDGLRGEAIPLASRIVFACDAYDAMVSDRPYRRALTPERALDELRSGAGAQFDPRVAGALEAVLGRR